MSRKKNIISILLIIIGFLGLGFAHFYGKAIINLDPPTYPKEDQAFTVSFFCGYFSLLSIFVGFLLRFPMFRGLTLFCSGLFLYFLGILASGIRYDPLAASLHDFFLGPLFLFTSFFFVVIGPLYYKLTYNSFLGRKELDDL